MKNQTSFKPGQSGNLNGAPKKEHSIVQVIKDMMAEKPEIKKALAQTLLQMALKGDLDAIVVLLKYMDGMPVQRNAFTDKEGQYLPTPLLIGVILDELYDPYERLGQQAQGQILATNPPVQNKD